MKTILSTLMVLFCLVGCSDQDVGSSSTAPRFTQVEKDTVAKSAADDVLAPLLTDEKESGLNLGKL